MAIPSSRDPLLGLPFDLHERYSLTRRLVGLLWAGPHPRLRILDVGGHSSPLKHLLPEETLIVADPKPPGSLTHLELRSEGYVRASGSALPFANGSFDLVTAHDTLEHVPAAERSAFLGELVRVSSGFVIVNGPVYGPQTARAEEVVARLQERLSLGENVFLAEHRRMGLPQREEVERALEAAGAPWLAIPNGRLDVWLAGQAAKDLAAALFPGGELSEVVDRSLNASEAFHQLGGLCYRMAYVVASDPDGAAALDRVRASVSLTADPVPATDEIDETLGVLEEFVRVAPLAAPGARRRELEARLHELQAAHDRATGSTGYRLIQRLHLRFDAMAPWGTRRRSFLLGPIRALRLITLAGWGSFLRRLVAVHRWWPRLWERAVPPLDRLAEDERYNLWLRLFVLSPQRLRQMRREVNGLAYRPTISVILPVYDPEPQWLRAAIQSVRAQVYPNWHLCIVDDGSTREDVRQVLEGFARRDRRITLRRLDRNHGISGASNAGLERATGEFVGFLDHDDELKPNALFEVVKLLNERRDLDYVYSDEDKLEPGGWLTEPFFKPDWSPDLLMSVNYVTHFSVYRTEVLRRVGGFRSEFDGSQDYDLVLRVTESTSNVEHIPLPLYSWRKVPGSAAARLDYKVYAYEAGRRALAATLVRRGYEGSVENGLIAGRYRVRYGIRGEPRVVIVIPTRDRADLLERCVDSIRRVSTYQHHDLLVVDNGSTEPQTLDYLASFPGRVLRHPNEFNFSQIVNVAVEEAGDPDYVIFLNNDTEVIAPDWIEAMVEHGQRPDVAAVGARLLYPNGAPQHEGIVVGLAGSPARNVAHGYFGLGQTIRNCSAVTAACMLTRPDVFRELGGFEERLVVAWGDVDFCLRAGEKGYQIVYTPHALLYHDEGSTRGVGGKHSPEDDAFFLSRWGEYRDPYYNAAFDMSRPFELRIAR